MAINFTSAAGGRGPATPPVLLPLHPAPSAGIAISNAASGLPFRQMLGQKTVSAPQTPEEQSATRQKQADTAATGLVSNALILPMLQQLRRSSFEQKGAFSPGIGEKTFGPQFDMQLADRIASSPKLGVKNSLVQRMMNRGQPIAKVQRPITVPTLATPTNAGIDIHG